MSYRVEQKRMMRSRVETRPRVLLIGKTGQIGRELCKVLMRETQLFIPPRRLVDLCEPQSIRDCVRAIHPDVIINAAGYTAVDEAEREPELARAVNAIGPGILAEQALKVGAFLIHYSTAYVFDGAKAAPYLETDSVNPLSTYGETKLQGEEAIRNSGCEHVICRTGWVYSPRGSNFLSTMIDLAHEQEESQIVTDQIVAPSSSMATVCAAAKLLEILAARESGFAGSGTYHMTASCCLFGRRARTLPLGHDIYAKLTEQYS